MKNIVLTRKMGYNYKGMIFVQDTPKMVNDDCAEYLLSQLDELDVPMFSEEYSDLSSDVADETEAPEFAALSYEELIAKCKEAGIPVKGRPARTVLEELLAAKVDEPTA